MCWQDIFSQRKGVKDVARRVNVGKLNHSEFFVSFEVLWSDESQKSVARALLLPSFPYATACPCLALSTLAAAQQ